VNIVTPHIGAKGATWIFWIRENCY